MFVPRGVDLSIEPVLRILGYRSGASIRPEVVQTAEAVTQLVGSAIQPSVHYRRVPVALHADDRLEVAEGVSFRSAAFARHLSGCSEAIVFVLTLGSRLDSVERNLVAGGRTLEAVFLETAAWLAVEQATRIFSRRLAESVAGSGLALTQRLAPGYTFRVGGRKVEWPVEDQRPLFALFDADSLPVRVLESCAMLPKMSRTGLYGLRPRAKPDNANPQAATAPAAKDIEEQV